MKDSQDRLPPGASWIGRQLREIKRELAELRALPRNLPAGTPVWGIGETTSEWTSDTVTGFREMQFPPLIAQRGGVTSIGANASTKAVVPKAGWYRLTLMSRVMPQADGARVSTRIHNGGLGSDYGSIDTTTSGASYRISPTFLSTLQAGEAVNFDVDTYTTPVTFYGWRALVEWLGPM